MVDGKQDIFDELGEDLWEECETMQLQGFELNESCQRRDLENSWSKILLQMHDAFTIHQTRHNKKVQVSVENLLIRLVGKESNERAQMEKLICDVYNGLTAQFLAVTQALELVILPCKELGLTLTLAHAITVDNILVEFANHEPHTNSQRMARQKFLENDDYQLHHLNKLRTLATSKHREAFEVVSTVDLPPTLYLTEVESQNRGQILDEWSVAYADLISGFSSSQFVAWQNYEIYNRWRINNEAELSLLSIGILKEVDTFQIQLMANAIHHIQTKALNYRCVVGSKLIRYNITDNTWATFIQTAEVTPAQLQHAVSFTQATPVIDERLGKAYEHWTTKNCYISLRMPVSIVHTVFEQNLDTIVLGKRWTSKKIRHSIIERTGRAASTSCSELGPTDWNQTSLLAYSGSYIPRDKWLSPERLLYALQLNRMTPLENTSRGRYYVGRLSLAAEMGTAIYTFLSILIPLSPPVDVLRQALAGTVERFSSLYHGSYDVPSSNWSAYLVTVATNYIVPIQRGGRTVYLVPHLYYSNTGALCYYGAGDKPQFVCGCGEVMPLVENPKLLITYHCCVRSVSHVDYNHNPYDYTISTASYTAGPNMGFPKVRIYTTELVPTVETRSGLAMVAPCSLSANTLKPHAFAATLDSIPGIVSAVNNVGSKLFGTRISWLNELSNEMRTYGLTAWLEKGLAKSYNEVWYYGCGPTDPRHVVDYMKRGLELHLLVPSEPTVVAVTDRGDLYGSLLNSYVQSSCYAPQPIGHQFAMWQYQSEVAISVPPDESYTYDPVTMTISSRCVVKNFLLYKAVLVDANEDNSSRSILMTRFAGFEIQKKPTDHVRFHYVVKHLNGPADSHNTKVMGDPTANHRILDLTFQSYCTLRALVDAAVAAEPNINLDSLVKKRYGGYTTMMNPLEVKAILAYLLGTTNIYTNNKNEAPRLYGLKTPSQYNKNLHSGVDAHPTDNRPCLYCNAPRPTKYHWVGGVCDTCIVNYKRAHFTTQARSWNDDRYDMKERITTLDCLAALRLHDCKPKPKPFGEGEVTFNKKTLMKNRVKDLALWEDRRRWTGVLAGVGWTLPPADFAPSAHNLRTAMCNRPLGAKPYKTKAKFYAIAEQHAIRGGLIPELDPFEPMPVYNDADLEWLKNYHPKVPLDFTLFIAWYIRKTDRNPYGTGESWVSHFDSKRRLAYLRSFSQPPPADRKLFRQGMFMKREWHYGSNKTFGTLNYEVQSYGDSQPHPDSTYCEEANPRTILTVELWVHTIYGPWFRPAVQKIHHHWDGDQNPWFYASAVTPQKMTSWLRNKISSDGLVLNREDAKASLMDYGAFDNSFSKHTFRCYYRLLHRLGLRMNKKELRMLRFLETPFGYNSYGDAFRTDTINASGRDDTALLNIIFNMVAQYSALCQVLFPLGYDYDKLNSTIALGACGDDSLLICPEEMPEKPFLEEIKRLGFDPKQSTFVRRPIEVVFLGNRVYPALDPKTGASLAAWGPTIGRRCYKHHSMREFNLTPVAWLRGVSTAELDSYPYVPVLSVVNRKVLELTTGPSIKYEYNEYKCQTMDLDNKNLTVHPLTNLLLETMYDINPGSLEIIHNKIASVTRLGTVIRDNAMLRIMEVDNS